MMISIRFDDVPEVRENEELANMCFSALIDEVADNGLDNDRCLSGDYCNSECEHWDSEFERCTTLNGAVALIFGSSSSVTDIVEGD